RRSPRTSRRILHDHQRLVVIHRDPASLFGTGRPPRYAVRSAIAISTISSALDAQEERLLRGRACLPWENRRTREFGASTVANGEGIHHDGRRSERGGLRADAPARPMRDRAFACSSASGGLSRRGLASKVLGPAAASQLPAVPSALVGGCASSRSPPESTTLISYHPPARRIASSRNRTPSPNDRRCAFAHQLFHFRSDRFPTKSSVRFEPKVPTV